MQGSCPFSTSSPCFTGSLKAATHYDIFREVLPKGPPPEGPFAVDSKSLRKEFLRIQATAHPDRHPQEQKSRAEATSARINEAYRTLQDPLLRTQYLLSLKGIDVAEDETARLDDQTLLIDVLESQEEIESAQQEKDLEALSETNDLRLQHSVRILEEAFAKDDMETAKKEAIKLRYWTNIHNSIHSWESGKPIRLVH